jgi:formate dehydrogenase formation protein
MRDTHFVTNATGRPLFRCAFRCASIAPHAPVGLYNSSVTIDRPPRPPRAETREIVELKQLKIEQPELAAAVDMQVALVDMQRRVQSRVPLPWIQVDENWLRAQQAAGRPMVRFSDIPLEWSDFRLTFRQTADILQRFDALERADHQTIVAMSRDGNALEPVVTAWYDATSGVAGADPRHRAPSDAPASLDQVLVLALRPFLARSTEALVQKVDLSGWTHGHCPFCGWEPEFAVITPTADRRLVCGRCVAQWSFPALTCPFCMNDDRALITSFATRDGRYRVSACDVCRRYLKAYDARRASRPLMVAVDTIATLPLDAAAMQRGYTG